MFTQMKKSLFIIISLLSFSFAACSNSVPYIKNDNFIKPNIWDAPEIKVKNLSEGQKKIYSELGAPSYILVYKEAVSGKEEPREVHEWIYEKNDNLLWFVDGILTDKIAVEVPGLRKGIFSWQQ